LVSPVTVQVVPAVVHPVELGELVTVYPVTAEPLATAAAQLIMAEPSPLVAVTDVGADGTLAGTTAALGVDAGLDPALLVATTVKV
jgi:hypothetical protein